MSNEQQPEHMRPIPDGGLKDAMPNWLKRPPAWRNVPSAEERRERALPEPDTSEIDPRTLLDVGDLPQWLQTLAARGDVPVPEPDAAVTHAIEQVQVASRRQEQRDTQIQPEPVVDSDEDAAPEPEAKSEVALMTDEPGSTDMSPEEASLRIRFIWIVTIGGVLLIALLVILFYLL